MAEEAAAEAGLLGPDTQRLVQVHFIAALSCLPLFLRT